MYTERNRFKTNILLHNYLFTKTQSKNHNLNIFYSKDQ